MMAESGAIFASLQYLVVKSGFEESQRYGLAFTGCVRQVLVSFELAFL